MLNRIKGKLNNQLIGAFAYLLSVHILFLIIFSLFRFISFLQNKVYLDFLTDSAVRAKFTLAIFMQGIRFDNVVTCYIMVLPLVVIPIWTLFKRLNKTVIKITNVYFVLCGIIAFAISSADIPYLKYFNKHIGMSVFNWLGHSTEAYGMILEDKSLLVYFILFLLIVILFSFSIVRLGKWILKTFTMPVSKNNFTIPILFFLFIYTVCFFGARGMISRTLKLSDSFFCNYIMLNNLVMNPVFYILNAPVSPQFITLNDEQDSLELIKKELGFSIDDNNYYKRSIETNDTIRKPNIVLVLVESFSSDYLTDSIGGKPLMPYLNDLKDKSYYFDNIYSQGTHTNQGIISTLYGFPAIFGTVLSMKSSVPLDFLTYEGESYEEMKVKVPLFHGLPNDLKSNGYNTLFFATHDLFFDNLDYYLPANGFDLCFGMTDFPASEQVNTWGVSDKYLFDFSFSQIDSVSHSSSPFFANILTISNHPPYVIPEKFKQGGIQEDEAAMSYSDYCITKFMDEASKKDWYNNTIFVFLGDHGRVKEQKYDIPLSLTHIPLIIYSPLFENEAKTVSNWGGQIDVYATLMGLMHKEPAYNTFGINLLKDKRPYIYFTSDDKLGCLGNDYYYINDLSSGRELLYELSDNSISNRIEQNKALADSMKRYSGSMIEGAKHIFKNYLK